MSNVPSELFDEMRRAPQSFSGIFAFWYQMMTVQMDGETFRAPVQMVSGDFYSTLGVIPEIGRLITRADDAAAARAPVAVISHSFWVRSFGASRTVLGRTLQLDNGRSRTVATIVGVTPPEFFGADRGANPDITTALGNPGLSNLWVMGRLKPGVSENQARLEADNAMRRALVTIQPQLQGMHAADRNRILSLRGGVTPGGKGGGTRELFGYHTQLLVLVLLSTILLMITCANIAALLMARSAARAPEIGVRLAIGAGRGRLIRQLLAESALLSALGTVSGIGLAFASFRFLTTLIFSPSTADTVEFALDFHVVAYMAAAAGLCTLLFGLAPAFWATRVDTTSSLRPTPSSARLRIGPLKALVAAQVATSMLLVVVGAAAGFLPAWRAARTDSTRALRSE